MRFRNGKTRLNMMILLIATALGIPIFVSSAQIIDQTDAGAVKVLRRVQPEQLHLSLHLKTPFAVEVITTLISKKTPEITEEKFIKPSVKDSNTSQHQNEHKYGQTYSILVC